MEMKKKIGQNIKSLREKKGYSQIDLSLKLGVDNTVLSKIENGKRNIEEELLCKIADILEVSTDAILLRSEPNLKNSNLFFFDKDDLTEQDIEDIKKHIEFVKWQAKQRKKE